MAKIPDGSGGTFKFKSLTLGQVREGGNERLIDATTRLDDASPVPNSKVDLDEYRQLPTDLQKDYQLSVAYQKDLLNDALRPLVGLGAFAGFVAANMLLPHATAMTVDLVTVGLTLVGMSISE